MKCAKKKTLRCGNSSGVEDTSVMMRACWNSGGATDKNNVCEGNFVRRKNRNCKHNARDIGLVQSCLVELPLYSKMLFYWRFRVPPFLF